MVVLERPAIRPEPLSENARTTFGSASAPAWCLRLLHDANLTPVATPSRQPKASSEDSFIAETLATGDTISSWQSFYKVPQPQPRPSPATTGANSPVAGELVSLLALLGRGVNGHTNVAHGGLVATILDDTMGMVVGLHRSPGMSGYTASLNIKYRKPLRTPSIVLCRTWLESRSGGRKLWLRGTVEDGEGGLFAEAEGLWIEVQEKEPKL
ncbi:hypothetical protein J3459_010468 [Metarhizium acridum]|uniref:uncharacterized protein n=1 Tax=Metarhizium acridum TaxID=92637 RepID=UPI001C6D0EC8|nr:hypothetical protein J3458_020042 [Metarhizium acridum]KAG8422314.1 hypothetical protein J3459_010468 [Metarhizium acridum]